MKIARVSISFDRGIQRNDPKDIGLEKIPDNVGKGKRVRGLGTHWRSEEDQQRAVRCEKEEARIRRSFKSSFACAGIDGFFIIGTSGDADRLLARLDHSKEIEVKIQEFDLTAPGGVSPAEFEAWSERIQEQIRQVPLGRGKQVDEEGIAALESLALCPILSLETSKKLRDLASRARGNVMPRLEVRRNLETVTVKLDAPDLKVLRPRSMAKSG